MKTKGAVKVEVYDKAVKPAAQRLVYWMRAEHWQGDVEMVTLLQQLLEGCGAEFPPSSYEWDPKPKFVLLQGLKVDNRFFTTNSEQCDPRELGNGIRTFKIIGYAENTQEAQIKLYGRILN